MAVRLFVLLAAFLFEHDYLRRTAVLDYSGLDAPAFKCRRPDFDLLAVSLEQRIEFQG